jgi:hypothetical protein
MDVEMLVSRGMQRLYNDAGSPMTFRHPATRAAISLQAVDRTSATVLTEKSLEIDSIKPCATVRRSDLAALNIAPEKMVDVNVTFAGKTWRILSVHDKPHPSSRMAKDQIRPVWNWRKHGEYLFILMEA